MDILHKINKEWRRSERHRKWRIFYFQHYRAIEALKFVGELLLVIAILAAAILFWVIL